MPRPKPARITAAELATREQEARRLAQEAIDEIHRPHWRDTKKAPGKCRTCGSNQYQALYYDDNTMTFTYQCLGCSAHFSDPDLFFPEV